MMRGNSAIAFRYVLMITYYFLLFTDGIKKIDFFKATQFQH